MILAMHPYAPVMALIILVIVMVIAIMILAHTIGPGRHGRVKDSTYEAGVPIIGDARRRFNVKFYIVAMLFLLFDVEVVFLWPWAPLFHQAAMHPGGSAFLPAEYDKNFLLVEMVAFFAILLVGYVYAWRKGVFRWS